MVGSFSGTQGKMGFLPLVDAVLGVPWLRDVSPWVSASVSTWPSPI